MNKPTCVVVCLLVLLGGLLFGLGRLSAQRPPGGERQEGDVGRFVVARSSSSSIIILDTVTGDLYRANIDEDVKPYAARPRFIDQPRRDRDERFRRDKDKVEFKDGFKEKEPFKDRDFIKDKGPEKDRKK